MTPQEQNIDTFQAIVAVAWPFAQQWLKNSKLAPWISKETPGMNHLLSLAVAVATAAGLHIAGNAQSGWTLTIPPISALGHVVGQWAGQHFMYKFAIQTPETQKQILETLTRIEVAALKPEQKS